MDQKYWLDSTTVQASLAQVVPFIVMLLNVFNVKMGSDEVMTVVTAISAVWSAVAVVYAVMGRFKADRPLTGQKPQTPDGQGAL